MVTHEGPLLELGPWRAGEQHPLGHGGAHAQQVGGAGGGQVSVVARYFPGTGELIRKSARNLDLKNISNLNSNQIQFTRNTKTPIYFILFSCLILSA